MIIIFTDIGVHDKKSLDTTALMCSCLISPTEEDIDNLGDFGDNHWKSVHLLSTASYILQSLQ
jgi:hypothetical protein